jgi:hypothetical protein
LKLTKMDEEAASGEEGKGDDDDLPFWWVLLWMVADWNWNQDEILIHDKSEVVGDLRESSHALRSWKAWREW